MTTDERPAPMTEIELRPAAAPGVRLSSIDEAFRLADALSRSNLLPTALRGRKDDVLSIIIYGQELGLAPMQAISGIYIVEGRPMLASQTWLALARFHGHTVRMVEVDDRKAVTIEFTRRDDPDNPRQFTATIEDAQAAGKLRIVDGAVIARSTQGKALPWEAYTTDMLIARAVSRAARFMAPEIALGFGSEDEIEPKPVARRVAKAKADDDPDVPDDVIEGELVADEAPSRADIEADLDAVCALLGKSRAQVLGRFLSSRKANLEDVPDADLATFLRSLGQVFEDARARRIADTLAAETVTLADNPDPNEPTDVEPVDESVLTPDEEAALAADLAREPGEGQEPML